MNLNLMREGWQALPPIHATEGVRLPRGPWYSGARDAGRVMVAVRHPAMVANARVFVRGVYAGNAAESRDRARWRIEFGRELSLLTRKGTGSHATRLSRFSKSPAVKWEVLAKRGWELVAEPFRVREPVRPCVLEFSPKTWANLYARHREKPLTAAEAKERSAIEALPVAEVTPMAHLILMEQRVNGQLQAWTPERMRRLLRLMNMTRLELSLLIGWKVERMNHFMNGGLNDLPGPVRLWCWHLEQWGHARFFGKAPELPLMPSHGPTQPQEDDDD